MYLYDEYDHGVGDLISCKHCVLVWLSESLASILSVMGRRDYDTTLEVSDNTPRSKAYYQHNISPVQAPYSPRQHSILTVCSIRPC